MASNGDFRSPSAFRRLLRWLPTYVGMLYRVDWLAMFIFARFEIVQRWAGRPRNLGSPPGQATAAEPPILQTELTPDEIVRRIGVYGITEGLRLSKETVADVISFAGRAPCYGNAERHRRLDRCPRGQLIPAEAVVGDYLEGIADCDVIRRLWRDPRIKDLSDCRGVFGQTAAPFEVAPMVEFPSGQRDPGDPRRSRPRSVSF